MKELKDGKKGFTPRKWTKESAKACVVRCEKDGTTGLIYWSAMDYLKRLSGNGGNDK